MRRFDGAERATLSWIGRPVVAGEKIKHAKYYKEFPTFEEAMSHFMTVLPAEERDLACIHTASGERWFRAEIEEIFDPRPM